MAIKTVDRGRGGENRFTFPKLMICHQEGEDFVVLFTNRVKGFVVDGGTGSRAIGYLSKDWNPSFFEDYHGDVCMTNKAD